MSVQTGNSECSDAVPGARMFTLDNGLTLIVREDHSAPVVSAQAWCRAGSIHEGRWLGAGLSHVLEHMLFKGTTRRTGSRIDQEVQEAGGQMNAYTSFDRTVYWIDVPNTGAAVALDVLCDIMQNAALPAEELVKELDVIRREMDMGQDDPHRRSSRRLFETAYTRSPYRCTVIGYRPIFDRLQPADIAAYYREQYAPNNLFFVVVGDVRTDAVVTQIEQAFAGRPMQPLAPVVLPEEPPQTAPREVIEEAPVELAHLHFSWHIPDIRHPDLPALDVLAALLGGGRSSRLFQEIREKQGLVASIDAWTYNPGNPGLFGMSATAEAGKFSAVRAAMLAEIERIREEAVPDVELAKIVKQFIAGILATRKTMSGQAQDLGASWLAADDLDFSARHLAAVRRVTPADLQRVARAYLTPENRTLYALLPSGTSPRTVAVTTGSVAGAVEKFVLPNGLRLLVKEDHRLPFVEFRAVFNGGVLAETAANSGLTQLLARMLMQGTRTRTAEQLAVEIESLGGSLDTFGGNHSFGASAEVMRDDFAAGLTLVTDVLRNPVFPEDALAREREIQLAHIRAQRDHLLPSCGKLMRRALFGDATYGLDALGGEESVARLQTADVREYHRRLAVPANGVLAIYGDVKTAEVRAAVEQMLGDWPSAGPSALPDKTAFKQQMTLASPKRVAEMRDKEQAVLVIGFKSADIYQPDRHALELLQEACSDLGSRLFLRIRDELGLAYYVGAQHFPGLAPGYFAFYCGTAPDKLAQAEEELLKQAELLRCGGLTEAELLRSKAKLLGQKKIARQDLGHQAMSAALDELYGLGHDFSEKEDAQIGAVTAADIRAAAEKYLRADAFVVATMGPKTGN